MGKIYAVGVGPGSPSYVSDEVKNVVSGCDIVVGYKYTLTQFPSCSQVKKYMRLQ